MSEDAANKNTLSRRDALKVLGTAAGTAFVPQPLPFVTDTFTGAEFTMTSIAPEEIPGGIDLTLTEAEKADFERLYAEVKDRREFPNSFDYLQKIQRMLNVSRARDMRGDTFVNFMNDFIGTPVDIESHGLSNVLGLKEFIKRFSAVRDNTLNGLVSTGTYGFWTAKLVESFVYCFDKEVQDVGFDFNTGNNILAYTQIVPEVVVDLFDETADYYQVPLTDANGRLAGDFFDSSKFIPDTGFIQREVGDIDQICLGDLIFKDRRQGYVNGHAMVVTDSIRDKNTGHTIGINVFDGNVDGKMISNFFSVETLAEFRSVISSNESLGILRTQEADNSLHLKLLEHETILPMSQIPPELLFGTAEVLPDFSKIKEIAAELEKFADPKKRPEAIRRVIALSGLQVRDANNNITTGLRWVSAEVANVYICNLYSVFLAKALGLQDKISLWYLNGKPSDNTGELYSVARIHEYLNREARRTGLIDVTFAAKEDRERLLAQGYVIYCATRGHSFMIVPGQNKEGYIIPVMSQAGYDQPYESPNFSYKFIRPRSLSDIREDYPEDAIMWAVLLPNVIEPKNPYRTPLYDSKIPEGKAKNKSFELGWLTTIKDLKAIVGDKDLGLFEKYIEGKKEKLPTGNHIFQFAFDVVQAIQNYKMPIGIDYSQDPVFFTNYIKNALTGKGYGKIVNSEYADKIFSGIQARFVTKERSRIEGRFFQPLQCVDLHNLFSMAAKIPGAPVKINSLTGYAQDMAFKLFSGQTPDSSSGVIRFKGDRPTDLVNFKAGDSFFIAYDGDSDGHVGTIVTDPFVDAKGKITIGVADSNRHVSVRNGFPEIESDGMPRLRFMDYELFMREYLTGRDNRPTGRMVVLRKRK